MDICQVERPGMPLSILPCVGQTPQQRIAQAAGSAEVEKPHSGDKGCIGKMIAFSKTHVEINLSSCDCPRRAPLYHYNYTLCQGNSPQRSEKEMPYVADLLCAKDIAQAVSSLAEMMLSVGFLLLFIGEEIEAQRACVSCSAAAVGFEPKSNSFGAIVSFLVTCCPSLWPGRQVWTSVVSAQIMG